MQHRYFRPVSVTSVVTILLHKFFGQRLDGSIQLDKQPQTFRAGTDGYRDNIVLLDAILRPRYNLQKFLHVVTLEMQRAFDSVHTVLAQ